MITSEMIKKIDSFFDGTLSAGKDTVEVLNLIAKIDFNDSEDNSDIIIDGLKYTNNDVVKVLCEKYEFVESFGGSKLGTSAWTVIKCIDTEIYYKFDYEYQSYTGFFHALGRWSTVRPRVVQRVEYNYYRAT